MSCSHSLSYPEVDHEQQDNPRHHRHPVLKLDAEDCEVLYEPIADPDPPPAREVILKLFFRGATGRSPKRDQGFKRDQSIWKGPIPGIAHLPDHPSHARPARLGDAEDEGAASKRR